MEISKKLKRIISLVLVWCLSYNRTKLDETQ